jgi:hypothetical protein
MPKRPRVVPILLSLVLLYSTAYPQGSKPDSELLGRLKALPGVVEVKETRFDEKLFKEAYEYGVLEYPFAFWQYGSVKPADIPAPDAPAEKLFEHLNKTNAIYYYSDQGKKAFEPFQYQAFTEIGYYNYDITDFKEHMKSLKNPTNLVLCPEDAKIVYDPAPMANVYHFLQYKGDHIIYIYGELDPWSSTAIQLIGRTDAVKIVVKNSYHGSRVRDFTPEQKELFYSTLERWLGLTLARF